jgi:hypothetical protein
MAGTAKNLMCDGCGLPASPEHFAERIHRLEVASRFRPIHIEVLFVALAPPVRAEDDFYAAHEGKGKGLFQHFFAALGIDGGAAGRAGAAETKSAAAEILPEFQRRGYFFAYLSECPLPGRTEPSATISRLGSTLVRRIRFNYRPRHIALLGEELGSLGQIISNAGIDPALFLNQGLPLPSPRTGAGEWKILFQRAVASMSPS